MQSRECRGCAKPDKGDAQSPACIIIIIIMTVLMGPQVHADRMEREILCPKHNRMNDSIISFLLHE